MQKTLGEIAKHVGGELVGEAGIIITGVCGIKEAQEGDITFVANNKYFSLIQTTKASAIIAPLDVPVSGKAVIRVANLSWSFAQTLALFMENKFNPLKVIHPTAIIAKEAALGKNVSVGPYAVIEANAAIGDNSAIYSGCYIGQGTKIGQGCVIYPNVIICERVTIGNRVIIHSGTVIGSDGFGFVSLNGVHEKITQVGVVIIEDNVEIGANVTIDRARFDKTLIGQGTKIDNLVQIAHNVHIGKNCIIVSQVGISGSVVIEDNVVLAGQVGVAGHLTIGEGSVVTAKSGVSKSIQPKTMVWGIPAKPHLHAKRVNAAMQKLPDYVRTIQELKKRIGELEKKTGGG